MGVKFGLSQTENPAPKSYRAFSGAMTTVIVPATVTFLLVFNFFSQETKIYIGAAGVYVLALIRGIGMFLGNGQYYTTDPSKADNPPPDAKQP